MHELGIVFSVADKVLEIARDNDLTEIVAITMQIGEISSVIPDYLSGGGGEKPAFCAYRTEDRDSSCQVFVPQLRRILQSGTVQRKRRLSGLWGAGFPGTADRAGVFYKEYRSILIRF